MGASSRIPNDGVGNWPDGIYFHYHAGPRPWADGYCGVYIVIGFVGYLNLFKRLKIERLRI